MHAAASRVGVQATVDLVGVDREVAAVLYRHLAPSLVFQEIHDEERLLSALQQGAQMPDVVLLGMALDEPVRVAQRVHAVDKNIPILILSPPGHCTQLRRTLMFSPFLGSEVTPWSTAEIDELPSAIRDAAGRRQQRQIYLSTIASAQIRLEKLPLLQPEVTHYLDQLLDHAPIGVLTVDTAASILTMNRQAQRYLGVSERDALGTPLASFFPEREQARLLQLLARCAASAERHPPEIFEIGPVDESARFLEVTAAALAYRTGQRGSMLILQDVTDRVHAERERNRAEQELRFHATVLRALHKITSAQDLVFDDKLHQLLVLGCEQFALPIGVFSRIEGTSCEVVDAVAPKNIIAKEDVLKLSETFCEAAVRMAEPVGIEHAGVSEWNAHPSYKAFGWEAYIGTRVLVNGRVFGTLSFSSREPRVSPFSSTDREILKLMSQWIGSELQRERAEAHMRKLSSALEQAADAVMITDRDRAIEYVNPSFEQLTGYRKEEVIGHKTYFLRSGVHDQAFYDELLNLISNGGVFRGVLVNRKKDGTLYHEEKTIAPLKDAQGNITHFISTGHDITERKKADEAARLHQAELAHVARLSTLGEMTSGLAHELNQPLCAITTYAQTCLRILNTGECKPEQVRYGLEHVVRQAELAGEIFRRLRNFARKGDVRSRRINLRDVIREVANFIKAEAEQNQIVLKIESGKAFAWVDPIQIEQVLLNLVRNSIDAMVGEEHGAKQLTIRASKSGKDVVKVSISDTGHGCPPPLVEKLFEPFFTTKANGLGIGLGISQTIIEAHGGRLWLESNSDKGATFSFTLPSREAAHEESDGSS